VRDGSSGNFEKIRRRAVKVTLEHDLKILKFGSALHSLG
jgi:hypothetical protein